MPQALVSQQEWLQARLSLLSEEKAFTRQRDALSEKRRSLPWTEIHETYEFRTEDGNRNLADLFGGKSQLPIYHFMFGPDWKEGCPACSLVADGFDRLVPHLAAQDVAFWVVSRAPLNKLLWYRDRLGWGFSWASTKGDAFCEDFGVFQPQDDQESKREGYNFGTTGFPCPDAPGLNAFALGEQGQVYRTYGAYGRGLEDFMAVYRFLDATPKGRDEAGLTPPMAWVHRRDSYAPE